MTTEFEGVKTNEFLRRRKLRLQQVREQSKDIAKKIRQRANIEKLRQVTELESKKEQEYLQRQEKLVKLPDNRQTQRNTLPQQAFLFHKKISFSYSGYPENLETT